MRSPRMATGATRPSAGAKKKAPHTVWSLFLNINGRGGGIRTRDPLLPKQMRYQAALRPD